MRCLLVCGMVVLHPSELLLLEPDADDGQHEQGKDVIEEGAVWERMTMVMTDVGWRMIASNSMLKTRSLRCMDETLRYDDSSTANACW